ncbi:TPA: DNA-binding protein [bacterium]|nr:DNA-binding protein [bacterium]
MNKQDLVNHVVKATGLPKRQVGSALSAMIDGITKTLKKGERVTLVGFGTFSVKKRKARKGRNPQTGETIKIGAKKVASFKAGQGLAKAVK